MSRLDGACAVPVRGYPAHSRRLPANKPGGTKAILDERHYFPLGDVSVLAERIKELAEVPVDAEQSCRGESGCCNDTTGISSQRRHVELLEARQ